MGNAEATWAIDSATHRASRHDAGQPIPIAAPPTLQNPCGKEVIPPATMQMIENETAKFEKPLICRDSSWP